jgi:hypothetical protein
MRGPWRPSKRRRELVLSSVGARLRISRPLDALPRRPSSRQGPDGRWLVPLPPLPPPPPVRRLRVPSGRTAGQPQSLRSIPRLPAAPATAPGLRQGGLQTRTPALAHGRLATAVRAAPQPPCLALHRRAQCMQTSQLRSLPPFPASARHPPGWTPARLCSTWPPTQRRLDRRGAPRQACHCRSCASRMASAPRDTCQRGGRAVLAARRADGGCFDVWYGSRLGAWTTCSEARSRRMRLGARKQSANCVPCVLIQCLRSALHCYRERRMRLHERIARGRILPRLSLQRGADGAPQAHGTSVLLP